MSEFETLMPALTRILGSLAGDPPPMPRRFGDLPSISSAGQGLSAAPELWRLVAEGSAKLGSALMMGHMDTAPHPIAALSDALVSATNNNLLFRELSPIASRIEEAVLEHTIARLDLGENWDGTFVSGGSIANLTALFAACGGFADTSRRADTRLFVPAHSHASIRKAAAVLGVPPENLIVLPGDDVGRPDPDALDDALATDHSRRRIVVGVLGSTIHGAVDPIARLGAVAARHGAWFHIDAIYGGALAYSNLRREFLQGIASADSIVVGPQKWLYVPRLSSILLVRGRSRFDGRLGTDLPYSSTGEQHRGKWGLQGSRRADAVTLWLLLQVLGTASIGRMIDDGIERARQLHAILRSDGILEPTHAPDLNLQCFRPIAPISEHRMRAAHQRLAEIGGPWVSLSRWRDELIFRSVLLSPRTDLTHLHRLTSDIHAALQENAIDTA